MSNYKSYHTNLQLLHYFNALPASIKSTIPRSTLHSWKSKKPSAIIGCDSDLDNYSATSERILKNEKLVKSAKALYQLFDTVTSLFNNAENKVHILRKHKTLILSTIEKTKPILGMKRVLKMLGISSAKLYYWLEKKRCSNSVFELCQTKHPSQLLASEVNTIKKYLLNEKFKNWSALSIYYQAIRDRAIGIGLGTWYKYVNRFGIKRPFFKLKQANKIGIKSSKPLEKLHMDITQFRSIDNTRVYIYFIVDNYSRAILNWKASTSYSSKIALELLKGAVDKYNIYEPATLITDGGSENKGKVLTYIEGSKNLSQLIAQKDIIQSNSMVEAVNKHIKYYYLFKTKIINLNELIGHLSYSVNDYNNKPHGKICGFTPLEVLQGLKPTNDVYKASKIEAQKVRITQNKLKQCCQV